MRTNIKDTDLAKLWEFYLQLNEVEQAFKEPKGELSLRRIYHQLQSRIEAHIFVFSLLSASTAQSETASMCWRADSSGSD